MHAYERTRERGKVRGREKENRRGISVHGVGVRGREHEGYEGWCKGDGEAGGSASNEESQRLTKKKGRTLQFIDRPAVRAATRGVK